MSTPKKIATTAAVIVVAGALIEVISRSGSRSALERYKAELRAKGEKLTFKELAFLPSTNADEVACRQALDACSNLNANPFPSYLMEFVAPGKARVGWRGPLHLANNGSIIVGDWENFDREDQKAAPILAPVILALRSPSPDSGWVYDDVFAHAISGPPGNYVRDRAVALALAQAEIGHLHRGNFDEAEADIHALAGMAQMDRNEPALTSQMMRVSIAEVGLDATWETLQSPAWGEPRLAALQKDWEQENFFDGLERAWLGERASSQVIMAMVRRSSSKELSHMVNSTSSSQAPVSAGGYLKRFWNEQMPGLLYSLGGKDHDELFQLKHYTRLLKSVRDLKANRPWPEVGTELTNLHTEIDREFGKDRFNRLMVSAITIPSFTRMFQRAARMETYRRLAVTAIALKRYQHKYGRPPQNLGALTPEFLAAVPIDPMSGKQLGYRPNPDGSFVLYSVGEDGKDDGGDPTPVSAGTQPGLWEGRDAVWPLAVEEDAVAKGK